jgi:S1-C subfamily serine protease
MIKKFNKMGLLILSLISIIIAIKSSYFLEVEDLHKENFVMLDLVKYFNEKCDSNSVSLNDTGDSLDHSPCVPGKFAIYNSTASGLLLKKISDSAYILTANHFCNIGISETRSSSDSEESVIFEDIITISDSESRTYSSEVVYEDETFDLCLLRSNIERDVDTIKFSEMPEIGEKIFTIASPLGISDSGILLHFEGFFSGCENTGMCFYTIPATSGSSGSVVFDMRGRAIGIIQMTPVYFRSMSIGVGSRDIISFLESASKKLGVDLI